MFSNSDTVKLIFGFKMKQLRQQKDLSYQQLSQLTGLSLSYLHDIETGKKYPKTDKILVLAKALDTDYDYLVSLQASKKLQPVIDLLQSNFLTVFPLELFGISSAKIIELLMHTPDKVNAFISTILKIIRNYQLQGEDFYKVALRSYQNMHDNYFEELEQAVQQFRLESGCTNAAIRTKELERALLERYGIQIDRKQLAKQATLKYIRSFYEKENRLLFLNAGLSEAQENYLLGRELGFQFLQLKERPYETRMVEITSFDQLLNNFKASYFSVALLMDELEMVADVERLARQERWQPQLFLNLLDKYNVTPEMLIQRLTNILPKHFEINNLFFLRFFSKEDLQKFQMTKEMHLSQLHNPHANELDEHYCRRWVSISIIRRLKAIQHLERQQTIADAQISRYWNTDNEYLCLSIAKPDQDNPQQSVSVTIGLLLTDKLRRLFRFLNDPALKIKDVHTTCERCPIPDCEARAAAPIVIEHRSELVEMKEALEKLREVVSVS